jgi:hypothetical protein
MMMAFHHERIDLRVEDVFIYRFLYVKFRSVGRASQGLPWSNRRYRNLRLPSGGECR